MFESYYVSEENKVKVVSKCLKGRGLTWWKPWFKKSVFVTVLVGLNTKFDRYSGASKYHMCIVVIWAHFDDPNCIYSKLCSKYQYSKKSC